MKKQLISLLCITAFTGSLFGMEAPNVSAALARAMPRTVASSAAAASPSKIITIKTHDESQEWKVPVEVIKLSETLKDLLKSQSEDLQEIHLSPVCSADYFDLILPLMRLQYERGNLSNILHKKTTEQLMQVVVAANYLDTERILQNGQDELVGRLRDVDALKEMFQSSTLSNLNTNRDLSALIKQELLQNSNTIAAWMGDLQMQNQHSRDFEGSFRAQNNSNCDNTKTAQIVNRRINIVMPQGPSRVIQLPKENCEISSRSQHEVTCFAWHPQHKNIIAYAKNDGVIDIFDIDNDVVVLQLSPNSVAVKDNAVQSLFWVYDDNRFVITYKNGTQKSWQLNFDDINRVSLEQFLLLQFIYCLQANQRKEYPTVDLSGTNRLSELFCSLPSDIVNNINRSVFVKLCG